jgi:phosphatidate cytidylyltransferase
VAARIISALIALPFVLYLIWIGGWPFSGLIFAVGAICLQEITSMTMPNDRASQAVVIGIGLAFVSAILLGFAASPRGLALGCLAVIAILLFFLFRIGDLATAAQRMGFAFLSLAWAGLLLGAIGTLRLLPEGAAWVLQACVLAWGSDTGAYFAGRFLGKHKLYERVSPKKTWEGAIGGTISATLLAFAFQAWLGPTTIPLWHLAILAPIGAALGQMGDLAESLLKRSVGVKDSGKIMPGHGGLFDRIDALLLTAPWLLVYAIFVSGLSPEWLS